MVHINLPYVPGFPVLTVIFELEGVWVVQTSGSSCESPVIVNVILEKLEPESPPVRQ